MNFKMCGGLFSFCFLHETVFGNGQIAITHNTRPTIRQLPVSVACKLFLQLDLDGLLEKLPGPCAQQFRQRINTPCSTFQFNDVTLSHGGVSFWLVTCVATTNQPDTPPFFKCSNTRFSYNSHGDPDDC